jgi:hypothetical protein
MTDEQVATFLDLIELLEVKANQIVVKMNEPGDSMYFLLEGDVRVSQLIEEREILIAHLETGIFFGEMCLCDDVLRSADVVARELNLDPSAAAHVAEALRRQLVEQREKAVTEGKARRTRTGNHPHPVWSRNSSASGVRRIARSWGMVTGNRVAYSSVSRLCECDWPARCQHGLTTEATPVESRSTNTDCPVLLSQAAWR